MGSLPRDAPSTGQSPPQGTKALTEQNQAHEPGQGDKLLDLNNALPQWSTQHKKWRKNNLGLKSHGAIEYVSPPINEHNHKEVAQQEFTEDGE
jgi:hypothetical protein